MDEPPGLRVGPVGVDDAGHFPVCGDVMKGEVVMPTSLAPGDVTTMSGSCLCDTEAAEGRARVVEVVPSRPTGDVPRRPSTT